MNQIINIIIAVVSVAIIVLVLIQQQEAGFYTNTTNINRTRRGAEKLLYNATIILSIIFVGLTLLSLFI